MGTTFCCVTPCLNAEDKISITIRSVLSQSLLGSNQFSLNYIIQDGGSTDTTLTQVRKIIQEYDNHDNINVKLFSCTDSGMYDAISKAFKKIPNGDIFSYLNAGDYYSPYAFEIVNEIFSKKNVYFLTGLNCFYNEKNHLTDCFLPLGYNRNLLLKGFYGSLLPHIQQESTFWNYKLQCTVDFELLKKMKFAGDYFLWKTFVQNKDITLHIVNAWLGGFKTHKGQLTERFLDDYVTEMKNHADKPSMPDYFIAYFYKILLLLPEDIKKHLFTSIFRYNSDKQSYCLSKHSFS